MLVLLEVRRRRRVGVAVREAERPVGWRRDLVDAVAGRVGVLVRLAWPGDALLGPEVRRARFRRQREVAVRVCGWVSRRASAVSARDAPLNTEFAMRPHG